MKKTILFALLIFLIPSVCLAGSVQDKLKAVLSAGGAAACTTVHATNASAESGLVNHNVDAASYWRGQYKYFPGSDITVCKVDFILTYHGDISTYHYYVDIATHGAGDPPTLTTVIGTSDSVTGSNSWSSTTVSFVFSTPVALSSATNYAIILRTDGAASASNYAMISISNSGGIEGYSAEWASDKSGAGADSHDMRITIYKQ